MRLGLLFVSTVAGLLSVQIAKTQPIETVEVIGVTSLGGTVDLDRVAANVQVATSEDIRRRRAVSLADFMNSEFGSVFVNEAQSNPVQPDLQYRGYIGSPLLGNPQGIAVYQDGVRINEPFGDTVNWALIPSSAINSAYLMPGSNPLFGLNALGGAISIKTKNGFTHPGTSAEFFTGSFSRKGLTLETGGSKDDQLSFFLTTSYLEEDGWRDFSPSEASQLFANLGWLDDRSSLGVSYTGVDTDLIGNGPAPAELLKTNREAIFTRPDQTRNKLNLLNLSGSYDLYSSLTLNGNVYIRNSDVITLNGDDSDFEECEHIPAFVCHDEDDLEQLVLDKNGSPIAASERVETATVNRTATEQESTGFSIQADWTSVFGGDENLFVLGIAYDESDITFNASTELGALDATRQAIPSGVFVGGSFTRLNANVRNTGFYFSNVLMLSEVVSFSISGRNNKTEIILRDQLGTALNGNHEFERFNPAVGFTVDLAENLSFYTGYNESNRAPSPVELTCADEDDPCRLPNAFLSDPPLKDVVARTVEAGFRGVWNGNQWHVGIFRAVNEDDILFVSSGALTNSGFFENVGQTRRDGVELSLRGNAGDRVAWFANLTYLDATFREYFSVASPNNPKALDGELHVEPGDRLPLVPRQLFKAGLRFFATSKLDIDVSFLANSDRFVRGDESNVANKIGSYAIANINGAYTINENVQIYLDINNIFDSDYETFGLFGEADEVLGDEFDDPQFISPGSPRAVWFGLRAVF